MKVNVAEADLTTQNLADILGCTSRMVNLYRASIEQRTQTKLGYKIGKTTYFRPDEQQAIRGERDRGVNPAEVGQNAQKQAAAAPKNTMAEADEVAGGSMSAMVAQSDRQAAQMGEVLGERFVGVMAASMSAAIARGMTGLHQSMMEMTAGLQTSIPAAPAIVGGNTAALPAGEPSPAIPSLEDLQDD